VHDPVDQGAPIPTADRQAAMRAAARRCIDVRRLRAIDVAVLVLPAIGAIVVGLAVNRALIAAGFSPSGVAFGFASGLLYVGFGALVYRRRYTRLVFEELRARGHDVCPKCGYFRSGIADDSPCPECGVVPGGSSNGESSNAG
jgi:hypothetical protein